MDERLREFSIAATIISLATVAGYLIAPIEVRFLSSLTSDTVLVGLTFAIGSVLFGILSLWLGRLSDRFGRRRFILIGLSLGILYPLMYASTVNIFQYMGFKFVWAFSAVATGPIFMAYLQDLLSKMKNQGHYMGMLYSIQSISGAGASLLGGYLSDTYSIILPFLLMSVVFVAASLIAVFGLKPGRATKVRIQKSRGLLYGMKYIFRKPALIFYFVNNSAFGINWGIKIMLWPLIIFGMAGLDTITGSIFATMGIVAFIMLMFTGRLVDRIGPYKCAFISMTILGSSGIVLGLTSDLAIFWVAAAFFALGEALYGPMQAVLITNNVSNQNRGEILGLDAVNDRVLNTISPFAAGLLLTFLAAQSILLIYVGFFWISVALSLLIYRTRIQDR